MSKNDIVNNRMKDLHEMFPEYETKQNSVLINCSNCKHSNCLYTGTDVSFWSGCPILEYLGENGKKGNLTGIKLKKILEKLFDENHN